MTTVAAATPINTFADILAALERNPDLADRMRQHILTQELQALPAAFARMQDDIVDIKALLARVVERQDRAESDIIDLKAGQARLEAGQAQHSADIADLKAGQARLEAGQAQHSADIADLKAGQAQHSADIADLKAGQAEIVEKQTSMQGQLNRLTGTDYERKIARSLRRRAYRHFGVNDAELTHSVTLPNSSRIPDLLDAACDQGIITDDEVDQAQVIDIVISGVTDANQPVYAAIEASVTVGYSDVSRARERAAIISRAAGVPVSAGVVGTEIPDAVRQNADDNGVTVVIMPD